MGFAVLPLPDFGHHQISANVVNVYSLATTAFRIANHGNPLIAIKNIILDVWMDTV